MKDVTQVVSYTWKQKQTLIKGKIKRRGTNNKNIKHLCKGVKDFNKGYQARVNVIKN